MWLVDRCMLPYFCFMDCTSCARWLRMCGIRGYIWAYITFRHKWGNVMPMDPENRYPKVAIPITIGAHGTRLSQVKDRIWLLYMAQIMQISCILCHAATPVPQVYYPCGRAFHSSGLSTAQVTWLCAGMSWAGRWAWSNQRSRTSQHFIDTTLLIQCQ